ncbi:MAG: hypothetical protein OXI87_11355 [Albidovulum sp.]|nr:hypothetical protein [Albidovulum sp.]MDE0305457.1 hypothetical protein [Albidovulum sp.]MDE0532455.1 hypothetical protein [Albidovulum sp.]
MDEQAACLTQLYGKAIVQTPEVWRKSAEVRIFLYLKPKCPVPHAIG